MNVRLGRKQYKIRMNTVEIGAVRSLVNVILMYTWQNNVIRKRCSVEKDVVAKIGKR